MSEFKLYDKVVLNKNIQTDESLLMLFRIAKEKYNQNYLFITGIRYGFFECSINFSKSGVMALPWEIQPYNNESNFKTTKQEFDVGTRVNIPELNMYNYIYLTTIESTRILVDKSFEGAFLKGYEFKTITVAVGVKITTQKKITFKQLLLRLNKKDEKILLQVLKDWNLLKSDETIVWE